MNFESCSVAIKVLKTGYILSRETCANPKIATDGLKIAAGTLRSLLKLIRMDKVSVSKKQQLLSMISEVRALKVKLSRSAVRGGNLTHPNTYKNRVRWEDVTSAFDSRIRTGGQFCICEFVKM